MYRATDKRAFSSSLPLPQSGSVDALSQTRERQRLQTQPPLWRSMRTQPNSTSHPTRFYATPGGEIIPHQSAPATISIQLRCKFVSIPRRPNRMITETARQQHRTQSGSQISILENDTHTATRNFLAWHIPVESPAVLPCLLPSFLALPSAYSTPPLEIPVSPHTLSSLYLCASVSHLPLKHPLPGCSEVLLRNNGQPITPLLNGSQSQ